MLTDVIDVYTITENVAILHNAIALVNADPVLYASVWRHGCVALAPHRAAPRWPSAAHQPPLNSASNPSPVVSTSRPRWVAMIGLISSARIALIRRRVSSSSAPMSDE